MASTALQEWASKGQLKSATFSEDSKSLSLEETALDATEQVSIEKDGKSCKYSIASLYLQILDPSQGLLVYRNACKKHAVSDPVKALDKPTVVGFFLGDAAAPEATAAAPAAEAAPAAAAPRPSSKKRKHDKKERSKDKKDKKDKKRSRSDASQAKKPKEPKIMTNEQVLDNLNVVVGKREGTADDTALNKALSAEGFEVTPELIKEKAASVAEIIAQEIPVGNSASILRPAPSRDFSRVLDLFMETEKKKKPTAAPTMQRSYLIGKKPIIVVPKGMTSPITLLNAHEFFCKSLFVPRDVMMKKGGATSKSSIKTVFTHKMDARKGGGSLEVEIMDNPTSKLGNNPKEWERIVAVLSLGASWQFKDWPRGYSTPVDLFTRVSGFFIGLEGANEPADLSKWNVKKGYLNRDKRGLDSVCFAKFWDGLENHMVTKRPELLPQKPD